MRITPIIFVLMALPINLHAQTCYQLIDAAGNTVYADKSPPYSLAHPPVDDPRRVASRQRGEHLVISSGRNCSVRAPTAAQRPSSPTQSTSPPPTFSNTPSYSTSPPPQTRSSEGITARPAFGTSGPSTQQRPRLDPEKLRILDERLAAFYGNPPTTSLAPSLNRPGDRLALILNEPRAFLAVLGESIPGAVLAYVIVWLGFWVRHKRKLILTAFAHFAGITVTIVGSAMIRLGGFLTYPGLRVYDPPTETGEAGLWVLIIPGVVALFYLYLYSRTRGSRVTPSETSASSPLHELALREIERGNMESGIWENAQQIGKNDRAKTEGAYVALRVAQFEHLKDSQKTEHSNKPRAAEDLPITQKDGRNLLPRLLGGEVGLAKTFWLLWFFPVLLLIVFFRAFIEPIPSAPVIAAGLAFFAMYKIVALRAVWLATTRYTGPRVWSLLARLVIAFGLAGVVYEVFLMFELVGAL